MCLQYTLTLKRLAYFSLFIAILISRYPGVAVIVRIYFALRKLVLSSTIMILRVETSSSPVLAKSSNFNRVSALDKWKTDWFHEVCLPIDIL